MADALPRAAYVRLEPARGKVGRCARPAATLPIAEDFTARLGVPAMHVPQRAWDPADDIRVSELGEVADMLDSATVNIVHTGKLSGPRGRDPRPLFEALAGAGGTPAAGA